jgi:hypothetical protein
LSFDYRLLLSLIAAFDRKNGIQEVKGSIPFSSTKNAQCPRPVGEKLTGRFLVLPHHPASARRPAAAKASTASGVVS